MNTMVSMNTEHSWSQYFLYPTDLLIQIDTKTAMEGPVLLRINELLVAKRASDVV